MWIGLSNNLQELRQTLQYIYKRGKYINDKIFNDLIFTI